MKSILSAFLLLTLSSVANALPSNPTSIATSYGEIRNANIHVLVSKTFKKKMTDGSYQTITEKICELSGEVPVFDDSQKSSGNVVHPDVLDCKTNLKSGATDVVMTGYISLAHGLDPLENGQKDDFKIFGEMVMVQSGTTTSILPFATAMVPDLNSKTTVLSVSGDRFNTYEPGEQTVDEQISVVMKFEDK